MSDTDILDKLAARMKPGQELVIFYHQLSSPGKECWEAEIKEPYPIMTVVSCERTSLRAALEGLT